MEPGGATSQGLGSTRQRLYPPRFQPPPECRAPMSTRGSTDPQGTLPGVVSGRAQVLVTSRLPGGEVLPTRYLSLPALTLRSVSTVEMLGGTAPGLTQTQRMHG